MKGRNRRYAALLAFVLLFTLLLPCTIAWASASDQSARSAEQKRLAMPDWYPENWADFEYFYDPDAPQLTDAADIFTDEEETLLREQLKTLRETYGTDFVVFTDVSTCGLSRKVYAADFFEATGHGLGQLLLLQRQRLVRRRAELLSRHHIMDEIEDWSNDENSSESGDSRRVQEHWSSKRRLCDGTYFSWKDWVCMRRRSSSHRGPD